MESGKIESIQMQETDEGTKLLAKVHLANHTVWIGLPARSNCHANQRIQLINSRVLLGDKYSLGPTACLP